MTPNDYLVTILAQQTLEDDGPELRELRRRRKEIENTLRRHFSKSTPSIRWGGSMVKQTMILKSYDGDMTCFFPHEEVEAGATLEEVYDNTAETLGKDYVVERKASALRVKDPSTKESKGFAEDLHIDVVPGRFTGDDDEDVFLHRTTGDKKRLKTNLQVHIDYIRDSGLRDAIRLMKLWNVRNGIGAKTFVLELLVVELLKDRKNSGLAAQLKHVWTEFRDNAESLGVEDPANPNGNDLKPRLDDVRLGLATVAATTLSLIDGIGWKEVFGEVEEYGGEDEKKAALKAASVHVRNPTKPWLPGA
jgi:hypothetical protein